MKRSFAAILIAALALVAQTASAGPVAFDFASDVGATIKFTGTGDTIDFSSTGVWDFTITGSGSPSLVGLKGVLGGTFTVGAISNPFPGVEQAAVTTSAGTFAVNDGAGNLLTAALNLVDITVYNSLSGVLNGNGVANLSNLSYSGSNSDLHDIHNGQEQTVILTFQFSPLTKKSLAQLMTDGQVNSTSFSGSLSSVPEPSALVLLTGAAIGLVAFVRRRKT